MLYRKDTIKIIIKVSKWYKKSSQSQRMMREEYEKKNKFLFLIKKYILKNI